MSEGFLGRWSRRKQEAGRVESPGTPPTAAPQPDGPVAATVPAPDPVPGEPGPAAQGLPTLEQAQALTPSSDFQPFMQRGVGTQVRNAAMKKLFSDPHFNVMDGLDVYIDDYSQPDPLPAGMLRRMASAQFLGLTPQDERPARSVTSADPVPTPYQDPAATVEPRPISEDVAQSDASSASAGPSPHDHTDLQLQPDRSIASPAPGAGTR
jgi:Protein of unknown function (DUF3306)